MLHTQTFHLPLLHTQTFHLPNLTFFTSSNLYSSSRIHEIEGPTGTS
jgi:hypothetical protein